MICRGIITVKSVTLSKKLTFLMKSLKHKKRKVALNLHRPIKILQSLSHPRELKHVNITSKYFGFFNNRPPAS